MAAAPPAVDPTPGYVRVRVTSSLSSHGSENKILTSITVGDLKGKLELVTGATASMSELKLYDADDKLVCSLDDNQMKLSSYPIDNGFKIHVINHDPSKKQGEFDDLSKVEKYEMSDDAYSKRSDSLLAFKQRMKLGRFAENGSEAEREAAAKEEQEEAEAKAIPVGARCEVTLPGTLPRRGTVMFVGKTHFKSGYFVGVKFDEPTGKNDGSVEGKRYFECLPNYGGFVRPKNVKVGDFPEETFSDDEM